MNLREFTKLARLTQGGAERLSEDATTRSNRSISLLCLVFNLSAEVGLAALRLIVSEVAAITASEELPIRRVASALLRISFAQFFSFLVVPYGDGAAPTYLLFTWPLFLALPLLFSFHLAFSYPSLPANFPPLTALLLNTAPD